MFGEIFCFCLAFIASGGFISGYARLVFTAMRSKACAAA
jgi:hypothetical protein